MNVKIIDKQVKDAAAPKGKTTRNKDCLSKLVAKKEELYIGKRNSNEIIRSIEANQTKPNGKKERRAAYDMQHGKTEKTDTQKPAGERQR